MSCGKLTFATILTKVMKRRVNHVPSLGDPVPLRIICSRYHMLQIQRRGHVEYYVLCRLEIPHTIDHIAGLWNSIERSR